MASDQQLALSRPSHRLPHNTDPSHVSKQSRQVVPAFLQKLYEMVNDPKNTDLIRWSDAGDSFFVLDHERFAREVLGRWFKHQNFSSFVRQLNMYGFHKIPHLHQGVLRSETDTEFWNFAHPSFHRGQPDLLCLIQRKKQTSQQQQQQQQQLQQQMQIQQLQQMQQQHTQDDVANVAGAAAAAAAAAAGLVTDGNPTSVVGPPGSTGLTTLNHAQLLDIHSIVQGITAIKRHQTAISTELSELRRSNELLWQDALVAREKHQKQEDTINKIVKFLAGVFGKQAAGDDGLGAEGHHHHHHHHHHHGGGDDGVGGGGDGEAGGGRHGDGDHGVTTPGDVSVQRRNHAGGGQQGVNNDAGVVTRRRARLMIEDGRRQNKSVPAPPNVVEVTEDDDEDDQGDVVMTGSDAGGVGGTPLSPMTTLSEYRSPPSPPSVSSLDPHETGDNNTLDPFSFSSLDLSDMDTGSGGPGRNNYPHRPLPLSYQQQQQQDRVDYSRIEMEAETPKSSTTTTPLPAVDKENVGQTQRALTRTPPIFSSQPPQQQQNNNNNNNPTTDANPFSFDPKNLMINLTPAQIQQLLMSLAVHPLSDPAAPIGVDGSYESGFLVPLEGGGEGNDGSRREPPPFDLSSYLLQSPQLSSLSLVPGSAAIPTSTGTATTPTVQGSNGSTGPAPTSNSSSSSTTPVSATPSTAATTPQTSDSSSTYRSTSSTSVPVPDGLISFDQPAPGAAATGSTTAATATTTPNNAGENGNRSGNYTGDLSVGMRGPSLYPFPWYAGPSATATAVSPGTGNTPGAYAAPAVQGYTGYGVFPYSAGGGWNNLPVNTPSTTGSGGSPISDFSGLFTPLIQSPTSPSPAPSTSDTLTPVAVGAFNPQYNNNNNNLGGGEDNVNALISSQPHLEALASNWHATEDIDRDVNALNTTIHSLIQTLGLDPTLIDNGGGAGGVGAGAGGESSASSSVAEGGDDGSEEVGTENATVMNGVGGRGKTKGSSSSSASAAGPTFDFDSLLNAWGSRVGGGGGSGIPGLSNDTGTTTTTTGSGSTPSTADDDADETSTDAVGVVVNSPPISLLGGGGGVDTSPSRPISKKARTSLTTSTATSAGVPTTMVVEPPGAGTGRKRRSTIVDGVDGAEAPVAQLGGQDPAGSGVQTRSTAKSKKRRG